ACGRKMFTMNGLKCLVNPKLTAACKTAMLKRQLDIPTIT
ncbi:uncharacterized protein METZ01_LOCUS139844, partial [marine metagenome]